MYKDFVNCYHPKKIRNSQGQWISVSCGSCPACLARMSKKASYQCSLQEQDFKYCMFVTLTYTNDNVPVARLEDYEDFGNGLHHYRLFDVTERLQAARNIIGNFVANATVSPFYVSQIRRKFHYFSNGDVPYLSRYDAQCFLKRFRKHLSNITNDKFSYYLVGEYGPVHFRPHFHVLFFFDSEAILQNFSKVLHKAWTLGLVDFSQSRGKCSSYVAQYVNSRNSVPRLYSDRSVRPFCLHSQKFAQRFYQNQKEEIYANENFRFAYLSRQVGSSVSFTFAWRSLVAAFFPKCRGFSLLALPELTFSYTLLLKARKFYGKEKKISELVDLICNDLYIHSYSVGEFCYTSRTGTRDYFLYFVHHLITRCDDTYFLEYKDKRWRYCDLNYDMLQSVRQSVASMLYLSSHFLEFVCDGDIRLVSVRLNQIRNFYNLRDYDNLLSQYTLQETVFSATDDSDVPLLYYLYDNIFPKTDDGGVRYFVLNDYEVYLYSYLSDIPMFQLFLQKTSDSYNKSVKHKYLNDLNDIFC